MGRPQAEILLDKINAPKEIKTILYAPTWEGFVDDVNYSSVEESGFQKIKSIIESGKYKLIFKPHPYTGSRNEETRVWLHEMEQVCKENDVEVVDKMVPIHELMNRSDALITDISSVLNEFLVTQKPIFLFNVKKKDGESLYSEFPSSRASYVIEENSNMLAMIDAVSESDSLFDIRNSVKKDSLSEFPEGSARRFISFVESL